jgi:hypothetical protein
MCRAHLCRQYRDNMLASLRLCVLCLYSVPVSLPDKILASSWRKMAAQEAFVEFAARQRAEEKEAQVEGGGCATCAATAESDPVSHPLSLSLSLSSSASAAGL